MRLQNFEMLLEYNTKPFEHIEPYINYDGFVWACGEGNLDLLKWMVTQNDNINISGTEWNKEFPFKVVCAHGYIDIAKWMLEINPNINISIDAEDPFRYACREGHLELAKWLLEIKPDIDLSCCFEAPFRLACENGHIEVAKWLLETKPDINVSIYFDFARTFALDNQHFHVVEWLNNIINDKTGMINYKSNIIDKNKKECCICYEMSNLKTSCGHYGCEDCFIQYNNKKCPYCRQQITNYFKIIN